MPLATNIQNAFTRVATEFKTIRAIMGTLSGLTTTDKTSLVAAINEVKAASLNAGAQINDTTPSVSTVYSSTKTENSISAAVQGLVNSSPAALDTLSELATALGNDANFATTTATALGNRVRVDAVQTLTAAQQLQARTNIGAGTSSLAVGTGAGDAKAGNWLPTAADISNATAVGRSVLTAVDAPAARSAIGAGTSSLVLGTTAGTAKAGDYSPPSATTGAVGLVQLTNMLGGTATAPTVRSASETATGAVELATAAETATGTDAVRAVHPAGLKSVTNTLATNASVGDTETDFTAAFVAALA